jgi:hypothetical protein
MNFSCRLQKTGLWVLKFFVGIGFSSSVFKTCDKPASVKHLKTIIGSYLGQLWPVPVAQEVSLKYVSQFVYHLLQFWKCLREEALKPDRARDGTRFNMQQFRKLFNSTRIPRKGRKLARF